MAEESWDSDYDPGYNPLMTLREKPVVINPRVYGKKTKTQKKAFRLEERRRWGNILLEQGRKNHEIRELEERHQRERIALQRRQEEELEELERQHEGHDNPLYLRNKQVQTPPNILDDCSWDNDNFVSPLYYIRKGVNEIKL